MKPASGRHRKRPNKPSTRHSFVISLVVLFWGVFLISEGLQLTRWGQASAGTPQWVVTIAGVVILLAGLMMMIKDPRSKWKDLLAALFCALMGTIGGWIALCTDEAQISGSSQWFSELTGLPLGRIVFGFGALLCFAMMGYALQLFYHKQLSSGRHSSQSPSAK